MVLMRGVRRALLVSGRRLHSLSRDGPSETLKRRVEEMKKMTKKNNPKKDELFVEVPESRAWLDTASLPLFLTVVGTALFAKLLMMHDDSKSQEMIERKIKNAPPGQGTVWMLTREEWEEFREVRPRTSFESKLARPNAQRRTGESSVKSWTAWYRRGKANAALGNYKDAMNDFNVAKMVEFSLGGKRQIETEPKMIGDRFERRIQRLSKYNDNNLGTFDEPHQWALSCVTTPDKGRGMASQCSIPQASLVHKEEPYAIVILKSCRESHCHYCLNELPADAVPCSSCSLSLYCSEHCRIQAGGDAFNSCQEKGGIPGIHCNNLEEYIAGVTLCCVFVPDVGHFSEHKHECLSVNWPAVFPSDIVLAGRILVKCISQRDWDLSHNYSQIAPESKLELHIYAILLLFCLQSSFSFELPLNGVTLSQAIILLSQIRLNSMAVVRIKSGDLRMPPNQYEKFSYNGDALTSCVEKVPVGQAIYKAGSLYNHSCKPNIHAYFCSRTLLIRTTEFVPPGSPLELSYGPQVGKWDCKDRLKFLEDKYSFQCRCRGCSALNLSDLVINAFCCTNPNCAGIVLDKCIVECELHKLKGIPISPDSQTSDPSTELSDKIKNIDISNFAHLALELNDRSLLFQPGCCLKCGSHCGMEAAHEAMYKAWIYIKRLQDAIVSEAISSTTLTDALRALGVLRSVLHASNKHIAEAEDNIAQAFCFAGDLQSAGDHCKMSTKILETLYDPDHIVVGYELVKLSTIQLSLDDSAFLDSVSRLEGIFMRHYGPHMDIVFPYLQDLKRVACSFRKRGVTCNLLQQRADSCFGTFGFRGFHFFIYSY